MKPAPVKDQRRQREITILAALLLFFIVVAIFTPQRTLSNDWRASSLSADPRGARIAYELGDRLGWDVEHVLTDSIVPDERTVALVLSPVLALRAKEVHALLQGVRQGGALVYAMNDATLNDSLHVQTGTPGYEVREDSLQPLSRGCQEPAQFSDRVITTFRDRKLLLLSVRDSGAARARVDTLLRVHSRQAERDSAPITTLPGVIGFPFGRGQVVVVGDVDLFRNENLRTCAWDAAVQVVRIFEYLRHGPAGATRTNFLFDEYHQAHGVRPGTSRAIMRYLRETASGKALAHLGIAGVILLLALGPRSLSPRDAERIERRSPLEHVDALARAYWQVHATRTASHRLLRGVRRRTEHRWGGGSGGSGGAGAGGAGGNRRELPDEAFLEWVEGRLPQRHDDVALVRRSLTTPMSRKELPSVADALRRIENDINNFRS